MARKQRKKRVVAADPNKALKEMLGTPEGLWRSARVLAASVSGYCAAPINTLIPVFIGPENPLFGQVPTMCVDRYYRCYANLEFVKNLVVQAKEVSPEHPCETCGATSHVDLAYVAGTIFHESQHPLREHFNKAMEYGVPFDPLSNIAMDAEINDDSLEIFGYEGNKVCIPPQACWTPTKLREDFDAKASGCSPFKDNDLWESYYVQLRDLRSQLKENQSKKQGQQQKQEGDDEEKKDSQGQGGDEGDNEEGEQQQGQGQSDEEGEGSQGQGQGQGQGQSGTQQGQGGGSSNDPAQQ